MGAVAEKVIFVVGMKQNSCRGLVIIGDVHVHVSTVGAGPSWAHPGPTLGPPRSHTGPALALPWLHPGPALGAGPTWARPGSALAHPGPPWSCLAPLWAQPGPPWGLARPGPALSQGKNAGTGWATRQAAP